MPLDYATRLHILVGLRDAVDACLSLSRNAMQLDMVSRQHERIAAPGQPIPPTNAEIMKQAMDAQAGADTQMICILQLASQFSAHFQRPKPPPAASTNASAVAQAAGAAHAPELVLAR